ncbi:MAG: hypothetical protein SFV19_04415 [Rhodospirillaceae bacterium]|nr:hypothetical protein [Rhodospirillaceae bacterium]
MPIKTRFLYPIVALGLLAALAGPGRAQQPALRTPPPEAVDLEGGENEPPPRAPEDLPELVPEDATAIKPLPPELPDRTRELLGDTTTMLEIPLNQIPNYRDYMRMVIEDLSVYARKRDPNFTMVTFGGFDLLTWSQREYDLAELKRPETAAPAAPETTVPVGYYMRRYNQSINGFILDGFFCAPVRVPLVDLEAVRGQGLKTLSVDHCPPQSTAAAFAAAAQAGIVAHVDSDIEKRFDRIPAARPNPENPESVVHLSDAKSMLVLLNNRGFDTKDKWLATLQQTNFDVLVVDTFFNGNQALTKKEVTMLKHKKLGSRRLVLAWLDVSHAIDGSYYWQRDWAVGNPSWINAIDPTRPGQYFVEFWNPAWKAIVGRTFAGIMDLGFDGVVLDGVEGYRRWEFATPVN